MSDFYLRYAQNRDIQDIEDIWCLSFGDSPELIRSLLIDASLLENAVVSEMNGHVRSCMFCFDGLYASGKSAAYIYALCTHPEFRGLGMGAAVVRETLRLAQIRGAEIVSLRPADKELEKWYSEVIGSKSLYTAKYEPLTDEFPASCFHAVKTDSASYAQIRGSGSAAASLQLLKAQEILLASSGGAFLSVDCGGFYAAACAECFNEGVYIHELICPPSLKQQVFSALSDYFYARKLFIQKLCSSGETGDFSLVYCGCNEQADISAATPYFPYTLN